MGELPKINYDFNGKKYRYFYSLTNAKWFESNLVSLIILNCTW